MSSIKLSVIYKERVTSTVVTHFTLILNSFSFLGIISPKRKITVNRRRDIEMESPEEKVEASERDEGEMAVEGREERGRRKEGRGERGKGVEYRGE